MNIATGLFTEAELLQALSSSSRNVFYEFTIADTHDNTLGKITITDASIEYDSTAEVMRTLKGTAKQSDLLKASDVDARIIPWMCLEYRNDVVRWPLGRFMINPTITYENSAGVIEFEGYDRSKVAYDNLAEGRTFVAANTPYTSAAAQICGAMYSNMDVTPSTKSTAVPKEWEIGTSKLSIVNELLTAISYNPLHFDEYGKGIIDAYSEPALRAVERIYSADGSSVILDGISIETDAFDIPNKFIRYTEDTDSAYLISTYTISDASNPYSTVSRGRVITSCESVKDIATQGDLDTLTVKAAFDAMARTEIVTFRTLNMPGHGYKNCLLLDIPLYGIHGKYIEESWAMELEPGGEMEHVVKKVVSV